MYAFALMSAFVTAAWEKRPERLLVESFDDWPATVLAVSSRIAGAEAPGIGVRLGGVFISYRFVAPEPITPNDWLIVEVTGGGVVARNVVRLTPAGWDVSRYRSALPL
jgi:hypothetical protein